jgi:hypothetical protein
MSEYTESSGVYQIKFTVDGEVQMIVVPGCCLPHTIGKVMDYISEEYEGEVEILGINAVEGEFVDLGDDEDERSSENGERGGGSINTQGGEGKPGYWSGGKGSGYLN